jgi:hypothetical protein
MNSFLLCNSITTPLSMSKSNHSSEGFIKKKIDILCKTLNAGLPATSFLSTTRHQHTQLKIDFYPLLRTNIHSWNVCLVINWFLSTTKNQHTQLKWVSLVWSRLNVWCLVTHKELLIFKMLNKKKIIEKIVSFRMCAYTLYI